MAAMESVGLAERAAAAAADAVRHHARALALHPRELRSITVELELRPDRHGGAMIVGSDAFVQWKVSSSEACGLNERRARRPELAP